MKLLAIDTSNWPLGVAVIDKGKLIGEMNTHLAKNHSLRLMPAIEDLFEQLAMRPSELDGVAVAQGPGSYTGVRIGVTTAKTLAWSLNLPLLGISSLQVIAQNRLDFQGRIIPLFDARRGQAYRGIYSFNSQQQIAVALEEDRLQLISDFLVELKETEGPLLFIGEGARQHFDQIHQSLGDRVTLAREIDHPPRASQLAYVAWKLWDDQTAQHVHSFAPEYLQLAEAEAKWLASQNGGS